MSMAFWGLFLIPFLFPLALKYFLNLQVSWKEYGCQVIVVLMAVLMLWGIGNATSHYDTEILNGAVTGKEPWKFSCPTNTMNPCRNGYSCNCVQVPYECGSSDSKGNYQSQTCYRTECDTCYTYPWEQNWYVSSNIMSKIEIDRVDSQGAVTPPRWSSVQINDPVSTTHKYKNWVRASSKSLFKQDPIADERYAKLIPEYPLKIYDYYNINRVLTPNTALVKKAAWNKELSYVLGQLGPTKQLNTAVVVVKNVDRSYANAARRAWYGFKKNDAILFVGVDAQNNVIWGDTMSWSKNEVFNVETRNYIERYIGTNVNNIDPKIFFTDYGAIAKAQFQRRSMKEFEYLKGDIPPPTWLIWVTAIVAVALSGVTSYIFHIKDLFVDNMNVRALRPAFRRY